MSEKNQANASCVEALQYAAAAQQQAANTTFLGNSGSGAQINGPTQYALEQRDRIERQTREAEYRAADAARTERELRAAALSGAIQVSAERGHDAVLNAARAFHAFLKGDAQSGYKDELLISLPHSSAATVRRLARELGNVALLDQLDRLQVAVDA